jgi:two-component system chemotaxis response regulator CheY
MVVGDFYTCPAEVNRLSKRVLIVDDSFGDRMVLRDYLLSFGYHVAGEARGGEESIEKFQSLKPDLVLLDAAMPDMDGVSVVRELRRKDHEASVLICVSRGQRSLAMEALGAGAKDFITKPIDPRRLRKAVQKLIG